MAQFITWRNAKLIAFCDVTHDIRHFTFKPDGDFIVPTAGAHIQIELVINGRADTRTYSLIGHSNDNCYHIAVKKAQNSRGGSLYMWGLPIGATISISQPLNHFPLSATKVQTLLIAGGIGITPIHSMAHALEARKADFRLAYAYREPKDDAFGDELAALLGSRYQCFVNKKGQRLDFAKAIENLALNGECYACGPLGFLDSLKQAWTLAGRPMENLRFETFGNSGKFENEAFDITIPRLDRIIKVNANETILEALEKAGIAMIFDCRRGECGLCALPIIKTDGVIDHRDVFFSDEEKKLGQKLCTCVSRVANGNLVLDTADRA